MRKIIKSIKDLSVSLALSVLFIVIAFPAFANEDGGAKDWQLSFQDAASPMMERITDFYGLLFVVITVISIFVLVLLVYIMLRFNAKANPKPSKTTHHTMLEVVWTIVPVLILLVISVPSLKLTYYLDRTTSPDMTLKVTGYQWYWGYEYPDQGGFEFSSYMIPEEELQPGQKRLLETDNRVVLPIDTNIRLLITAGDVLHSWAVPAFGIKMDAVPGRMNETWVRIDKEGVYYGQCSELCGKDHGFMPITIEAVSKEKFKEWVKEAKMEFGSLENNNIKLAYAGVE